MAEWIAARDVHTCGACGRAIPPGDPVCLMTAARLPRCHDCAAALGRTPPPTVTPIDVPSTTAAAAWAAANPTPTLFKLGDET